MGIRGIRDGCENIAEWKKKTAVVKDDASWQLSLSGLMKLGTEEDTGDRGGCRRWYGLQRLCANVVIPGR